MITGHKEDYQGLADRYCQHSKIFPLIEQITDHNLRQKLHLIYGERFINQYKGKTTKPSPWQVSGARDYNPGEILDYGFDMTILLEIMQFSSGKIPVGEQELQLF